MPLALPQQFTTCNWDDVPETEHRGETDETEVQDEPSVTLSAGMSYAVADNASAHRSRTTTGALLFIVD